MKKFNVTVLPRSSRNEVVELEDGSLKVKLTAAPVGGEANKVLVKMLAKYLGVAKSEVRIVKGEKSRKKVVGVIEE